MRSRLGVAPGPAGAGCVVEHREQMEIVCGEEAQPFLGDLGAKLGQRLAFVGGKRVHDEAERTLRGGGALIQHLDDARVRRSLRGDRPFRRIRFRIGPHGHAPVPATSSLNTRAALRQRTCSSSSSVRSSWRTKRR